MSPRLQQKLATLILWCHSSIDSLYMYRDKIIILLNDILIKNTSNNATHSHLIYVQKFTPFLLYTVI